MLEHGDPCCSRCKVWGLLIVMGVLGGVSCGVCVCLCPDLIYILYRLCSFRGELATRGKGGN